MDVLTALCLAALCLLAVLLFHCLRRFRSFQLVVNRIPGPPTWPLIGNVLDLIEFDFDLLRFLGHNALQYNHLFRVWLGPEVFVVTSRPEDIEIVLSSTKHIEKGKSYDVLHSWLGRGLLTSTGETWHFRRKLITPTFHFSLLEQFLDVFNRSSKELVTKLLDHCDEPIDVKHFVTLCALDLICESAMGTRVEAQKNEGSEYVKAVSRACYLSNLRMMKPWFQSEFIFNLSAMGRRYAKALLVIHDYSKEVISKRILERPAGFTTKAPRIEDFDSGIKKRSAFLDHLLNANEMTGANLSDKDIAEEVDTFIFEGHDTTASAITFMLYKIAAHPEVQAKIVDELDEIFSDSDRDTTMQDLQNMKYVERVVKETLRLYPSVPVFVRNLNEDLTLSDGYVVPAGVGVSLNCFMVGRNAKYWPDPERFDPDRFLADNTAGRHPFAFVPFSAGPRNCIGQKFAMMELKLVVSKVVRRCELSLPFGGYKPKLRGELILKPTEGVLINVRPRT